MRDWWLETFSQWGENPAIIEHDRVMNYGDLEEMIRITAERLATHGVERQASSFSTPTFRSPASRLSLR